MKFLQKSNTVAAELIETYLSPKQKWIQVKAGSILVHFPMVSPVKWHRNTDSTWIFLSCEKWRKYNFDEVTKHQTKQYTPQWSRFECEPQTIWMRPAPTRMIERCLCDTAAATASWASVDLDRFLDRTVSGDWFRRDSSRADGKRHPARCLHKIPDKFAIVSMAKKFLHHCIGAHARVHESFWRRVCMHSDKCFASLLVWRHYGHLFLLSMSILHVTSSRFAYIC